MSANDPILKAISRDTWELQNNIRICGFHINAGFKTDLASIPRIFWPIIGHKSDKQFQRAAIFHDYVIRYKKMSRKDADRVFRVLLRQDGVTAWKRWAMWISVRLFWRLG